MLGELVTCKWMDNTLCFVIESVKREYSPTDFYFIYRVYDFINSEFYWVDEEDLEKVLEKT